MEYKRTDGGLKIPCSALAHENSNQSLSKHMAIVNVYSNLPSLSTTIIAFSI